jgi:hypothetical protein
MGARCWVLGIGTERAFAIVQRMIEQAKVTAGVLNERQQRNKQGETMLRPSELPREQETVLLRAAREGASAAPDVELLRAHNGEAE